MKLYLDIDGVLNAAHNRLSWGGDGRRIGNAVGGLSDEGKPVPPELRRPHVMRWNIDMIAALNGLDLEIAFATTWRTDGRDSVAPLMGLNIPDNPFVLLPLNGTLSFPSINWKYDAMRERYAVDPGARFIWIDGELASLNEDGRVSAHFPNALLIAPDPNVGITRTHIHDMERYKNVATLAALGLFD